MRHVFIYLIQGVFNFPNLSCHTSIAQTSDVPVIMLKNN